MNEAKYSLENARHPDETYDEYRTRRRRINKYLKIRLRRRGYVYKHKSKYKKVPYVKG